MARLKNRRRSPRTARAVSCGGIVLRRAAAGLELVLGRRRREDRSAAWSLPKGTPAGDESVEQTALREVHEETGLDVRIVQPVGPIEYFFMQRGTRVHKTVHYFLMEATGGDIARHDHEFDEVRWVPVEEARTLMSYPTERDILEEALPLTEQAG
ncbi:MAG TPA: NUDIX hydrolase [Candidatus Limnocylindrales bacterium]|nr:NUDIX hydrolase [Candidatus Limnocylindrales bacterium]